jgi:hypothetical protein
VQVLLGQSGTLEDAELMPEPLVVEIERWAVPGIAILQGMQLQSSEVLNDGVEDGGANGSSWKLQSSLRGDDDVQTPEMHECAWGPSSETHERARGPSSGVVGHP